MATPGEEQLAREAAKFNKVAKKRPELFDMLSRVGLGAVDDAMEGRDQSPAQRVRSEDALKSLKTQTRGAALAANELGYDTDEFAEAREADRLPGTLQRMALTPVAAVLKTADQILARPLREVAARAYGMDPKHAKDAEDFHAARHQIKEKDIPTLARPFSVVSDLGESLGTMVGQATKTSYSYPGESGEDFRKRQALDVKRSARAGGDFAFDAAFDLSNALGLGLPKRGALEIAKSATKGLVTTKAIQGASGITHISTPAKLVQAELDAIFPHILKATEQIGIPARKAGLEAAVQAAPTWAQPQIKQKLDALVGPTASRLDTRPVTFFGQDVIGPRMRAKIDDTILHAKEGIAKLTADKNGVPRRFADARRPSEERQLSNINKLSRNAGQAEFRRSTLRNVDDMKARIAASPELRSVEAVDDAVKVILTPGISSPAAQYRAQIYGDKPRFQRAEKAANDLTALFKTYEPRLQALGVAPQPNKISGRYYPNNSIDRDALVNDVDLDIFAKMIQASPGIVAKHGGNVQNLKLRASDAITRGDPYLRRAPGQATPAKNPGFLTPVNLGEDLGIYADVIARGEGFKKTVDEMERLTGKKLGDFPRPLRDALVRQYPAYYESLTRTLERAVNPPTDLAKNLELGLSGLDQANGLWRQGVLTANPAHHTKNTAGDVTLGIFGGMASPARYLEALTDAGKTRAQPAADLYGIGEGGFLQRSDLPGNERTKNILELQRAAGEPLPLRARAVEGMGALRAKLPTAIPIGTTYGNAWEATNKRALYLDSMRKGMGLEPSVLRALDVGIDYTEPLLGTGGRAARMFQANLWPFARYGIGAFKSVASEFPGNLTRMQLVPKALRDMNQDLPNEAPDEVAQSGYGLRLPEGMARAIGQLPTYIGGQPVPGPMYLGVPQGQLDALDLPAKALQALTSGTGVFPREGELGRLLLGQTAEPVKQMFSYGFDIDPLTLQNAAPSSTDAVEGTAGLGGMVIPAPARFPINFISSRLGGPDNLVGGARPYDPQLEERLIKYLSSQIALPVVPGQPEARTRDVLNTPEARELEDIKRRLAQIRKDDKTKTRIDQLTP